MNSLGEKIRELRKKQEMSLDQLAQSSKVSKAYLSQLENSESDKPSAEVLYRISIALGTSIASLLGKTLTPETGEIEIPKSLEQAAVAFNIPEKYIRRLASLSMRDGQKEYSKDEWNHLYETLKLIDR
jgi:transcriptional regulator with XRE-family HTH domain